MLRQLLELLLATPLLGVTANWYGRALEGQWSSTAARRVDYLTDTIKGSLHTVTYAFDQDAHDFYDDVTNEVTGTNYTAGGVTLTGKTLTYDTGTNELRFDADDLVWANATISGIRQVVYRKDTGASATSPLLWRVNFDGDQSVSAATFTVQHAATGVAKGTAL